ncbi:MAG: molybdenum cofactor guanylyltransferase [Thermoprotei archaeon]
MSALGLPGAIVLAGGKSRRMGRDKSLLTYCGKSFIEIVVGRLLRVTDRVVVCVGQKDRRVFQELLPREVQVLNDKVDFGTPISGALTGFEALDVDYAALVGCDMPLIKEGVLMHIAGQAKGCSAAVPRWPNGEVEPLLAVYRVGETLGAVRQAIRDGKLALKNIFEYLADVRYVSVDSLRGVDAQLESLWNINTPQDYAALKKWEASFCSGS